MKTVMRKHRDMIIGSALLLAVVVAFATCTDMFATPSNRIGKPPEGMGQVLVTLQFQEARTLIPGTPVFTSYDIVFEAAPGSPVYESVVRKEFAQNIALIIALEPARWKVTVTAYQMIYGKKFKAAEGSSSDFVEVTAGGTSPVSVNLLPAKITADHNATITGVFTYALTYEAEAGESPGTAASISGQLLLKHQNGGYDISISIAGLPANGSREIPAGQYELHTLLSMAGGPQLASLVMVHIYAGMETSTASAGLSDPRFVFSKKDFANP